ncbi:hypothetical protein SteCoe_18063 [Stentor coeruleus]|uniref:Uncharacterized protein n=1 Tax=Stentor coeruleus TaxID=5963 RepID=A0A1R2BXU7_9CILI|nr:hypothetical protein SteCoe_18063 [Stentor coeruleus]
MEAISIKQALKKAKNKLCSTEKCNQISKNACEKCNLPSCKFHMCARTRNKKKVKICDRCNYTEIKEQIDAENQKEKKLAIEKLENLNEKNAEASEEARNDEKKLEELEAKLKLLEMDSIVRCDLVIEDIKKEQYLKDQNLQMLANFKGVIENSNKIYAAENEKLVHLKSQVSNLQIDVNQIKSNIESLKQLIKSIEDDIKNSITIEKLAQTLCHRCLARSKGVSYIKSVSMVQSRYEVHKGCARCGII